jgi:hypothetical protein
MPRKERKHSSNRSKKRGLARAGASLVICGIGKCLRVKGKTSKKPAREQTNRRPTKAKSSGRSPSRKRAAKTQRELVILAKSKQSGVIVQLDARVVKTLPDDIDGDQHQRFIIAIDHMPSSISTVLIAHNIDLAPRLPVERGSIVRLFGQYEWNERGGLLHWTHHDPGGRHADGWIELDGQRYD